MPPTLGAVERVQLVTHEHRREAGGPYVPVAGAAALEDVERSPSSFALGKRETVSMIQTGVLVNLAVSSGDQQLGCAIGCDRRFRPF
jgi:hypothetical protein